MTATTLNQSPVIVQTFMGAIYSNVYYAADTGIVNAISIPLANPPSSYLAAVGTKWATIAAFTNTSSTVTAKIGSLPALPVILNDGVTNPAPGQYIAGQYYELTPNLTGTALILLNPSRAVSSFTLTFSTTYFTVQQRGTINISVEPSGKTVYVRNTTNITGTSNSTSLVGTGVPAGIAPITSALGSHRPLYLGEDSGAAFINAMDTGQGTPGSWVFFGNTSLLTGGFTASGVKGFKQCELSFGMD